MYTVIRSFTGAPTLADDLSKRNKDIETEIRSIPGFIAYYLVKTSDGIASVTVCETQAGCDESTKRAANWLRQNMPQLSLAPPTIISGELAFKFSNYTTTSV